MSDGRIERPGSIHIGPGNASAERIETLMRESKRREQAAGAKKAGKAFAKMMKRFRVEGRGEEAPDETPEDERPRTHPLGMNGTAQAGVARTATRADEPVVIKG